MIDIEGKHWRITCSKDRFSKLKSDESFWALLTLARIINSLHFCQIPATQAWRGNSPSSSRQLTNSFLFASSVLYEGLRVLDTLGKHFKHLESFQNGFGKLLKDPTTRKIRERILKRIRDKSAFHFDAEVAEKGLQNLDLPYYIFATGYGQRTQQIYFRLADDAFVLYLLSEESTDADLTMLWEKFVREITDLMGKFSNAAQVLFEDVLHRTGWSLELTDGGSQ